MRIGLDPIESDSSSIGSFFYDAISVPFLKAEEGFPNDLLKNPWNYGVGYFFVLPRTRISPCVTLFFDNIIIGRVRHSIHLFSLEQIDLEQSPSFTHIWYRRAVPMERIKTIGLNEHQLVNEGKQVKRAERVKSTFCTFELQEASASLD